MRLADMIGQLIFGAPDRFLLASRFSRTESQRSQHRRQQSMTSEQARYAREFAEARISAMCSIAAIRRADEAVTWIFDLHEQDCQPTQETWWITCPMLEAAAMLNKEPGMLPTRAGRYELLSFRITRA
jgi:hypothetical protein